MQQDTPADNIPKEPELRPLNLYSGVPGYTGSSQVPSVTHRLTSEGQPGAAVLLSRLTAANTRSFWREPLGLDAVPGSTEIQVPSQTCKAGNMHTPVKLHHPPPGKHGHAWDHTPRRKLFEVTFPNTFTAMVPCSLERSFNSLGLALGTSHAAKGCSAVSAPVICYWVGLHSINAA